MPPRVHRRCVVGFLPHQVRVTVRRREVAGVAFGDRGHQARSALRAHRREEQMHVIAHQRIGVDCALGAPRAFAQRLEVGRAIA